MAESGGVAVTAQVVRGSVIRFDAVKGYGFISQAGRGEDVFLHVNDLLDDKHLIRPGSVVEFVLEPGERGPKASSVHVVSQTPSPVVGRPVQEARPPGVDDDLMDVLSPEEFRSEVTETLLRVEPALTAGQILAARQALANLAQTYGWIA